MAPALAQRGASTNFLLSFVIGAPMLNVTTMALTVTMLPTPFALTRIVGGALTAIVITYVVARIADVWDAPRVGVRSTSWAGSWLQQAADAGAPQTTSQLVTDWMSASVRFGLFLVPALWIWSVAAATIAQVLPPAFGNNFASVVLAALAGTFFMIPTWSEIPMALQLIGLGLDGPAAALLVVLPAISLPCMVVLGSSLRRFRMIALLSAAVMMAGISAGVLFL
jgi:uncharacterized membrane protein YraQ (UPF0718 family)